MANFKDYGENMFSTTNMIFGYFEDTEPGHYQPSCVTKEVI